jgi:miniconductance mechanosensitive channel
MHIIYKVSSEETSKRRPIKSWIQLIKVILYIVGIILAVTTVMNVSPAGILGGLGALSAVFMLVFKDSILGFVAGIQLSAQNMVRIGDWIVVPSANADGSVIDITLQSVVVQNWDNTYCTIPVYNLVSNPFVNWRGMSETGGRRIKRSLYLDQNSVRFLANDEIQRLSALPLLKEYMDRKLPEISAYNKQHDIPETDYVSGRHLTNMGTYRAYVAAYLKALPDAHTNMTNMVRYLQPDQNGLQMEIYLFSSDTRWVEYEGIQADIIDHLLAVLPEFGLRVFQNPSGADLGALAEAIKALPAGAKANGV